jgi:hypothetical protein
MTDETTDDLIRVRHWAERKIAQGTEPPWAFRRYTDLIALLSDILESRAATISLEDSLRLQEHPEPALPQAENIRHIDSARRRRAVTSIRLPM